MGGVGWGMLTSYSWYIDGWGGVGHVTSCSWYVDGRGGVGHVNVMFMVRGNFEKEHVAACCSMLQQGVDVETTTKKRVTINMSRFMLT